MKAVKRKWEAEYGPIEVTVIVTYKIDLSREVSFHIYIPDYVNAPVEDVANEVDALDQNLKVQGRSQKSSWTIITSKVPTNKTVRSEISRIHSLLRPIRSAGREHDYAWESLLGGLRGLPEYIEESWATYEEVTNGPKEKTV